MCSIGDDNLEDLENSKYMPVDEKPSPFSKCNKCRTGVPMVLLRVKDKYCKECFLAATVHKFKSLLGKHKLIRPNDRVLIVHKCGHPSTALLHFIRTGINLETHKKLRFEPTVVFIEDQLNLSLKERQELLKRAESEVAKFNFPCYFTTLPLLVKTENVGAALTENASLLELHDDDKTVITNLTSTQLNSTNKNDFLHITRQKFLIQIAKHLKCGFVFTPEISSDVASQLLTDVTLGRGSQIALNTGFCDFRDDVKILRPLRLFDIKELAFYNYLNNNEPVTVRTTLENPYKSVQQLMRKFVNDLQVNYPATVTTVLKTGDKLAPPDKETSRCHLCNAPVVPESNELCSAESTRFSHRVSTRAHNGSLQVLEDFDSLTCDNYCFSCRKLMK